MLRYVGYLEMVLSVFCGLCTALLFPQLSTATGMLAAFTSISLFVVGYMVARLGIALCPPETAEGVSQNMSCDGEYDYTITE